MLEAIEVIRPFRILVLAKGGYSMALSNQYEHPVFVIIPSHLIVPIAFLKLLIAPLLSLQSVPILPLLHAS